MPTASERVVNRPLTGTELKTLIRNDIERLLDAEGMLSENIAFGRVGWNLRLTLHVDNAFRPESVTEVDSRPAATRAIDSRPELSAVEPAPLADASPAAMLSAVEVVHAVDSPNAERLRAGLPLPVDRRQQDSTLITEMVQYPPDPSLGDGDVMVNDVTPDANAKWLDRLRSR